MQVESGRWYIVKAKTIKARASRFRIAHQSGKLTMSTDEIMALTRGCHPSRQLQAQNNLSIISTHPNPMSI